MIPPTGLQFLASGFVTTYVYNMANMQLQDEFAAELCNLLSLDGNTLYCPEYGFVSAYNWQTHALLGWTSSPAAMESSIYGCSFTPCPPNFFSFIPSAVDETGLLAGPLLGDLGFADGGALQSTSLPSGNNYPAILSLDNTFGPASGGTQVQISSPNFQPAGTVQNVYFGSQPVLNLPANNSIPVTVTSPTHAPGPVDVVVQMSTGYLAAAFQGFSFGPTISSLSSPLASADGGGTETINGFGLTTSNFGVTGVQAEVGTTPLALTESDGIQFTVPPGTAGTSQNLTVSNANGTTVLPELSPICQPPNSFRCHKLNWRKESTTLCATSTT